MLCRTGKGDCIVMACLSGFVGVGVSGRSPGRSCVSGVCSRRGGSMVARSVMVEIGRGGGGKIPWENPFRGGDGDDHRYGSSFLPAPAVQLVNDRDEELPALLPPTAFVGDPSKPLIILLSWMGAKQKHMEKFREYYASKGFEVVTFLNDVTTALLPDVSKAQAKRIVDVLEAQPEGRPVFVHAFSIGTGIYGLALNHIGKDIERFNRIAKNVAGVVMDSGPAQIFPKDVAVGLHAVCPQISKAVWKGLAQILFWVTQARTSFGLAEEALRQKQFPTPQMYFASKDDKVIRGIHEALGEFIETNRQRGLEVYQKIWDNSIHAGHYKVHREEYLSNLELFMGRCMEMFSKRAATAR